MDHDGVDHVDRALAALDRGATVVVADGELTAGHLVLAADHATQRNVAFMVRATSGVVCAALPADRADELELPAMVERGRDSRRAEVAVSVDARQGITTGISASDRAVTLRALADARTAASDLARPGHVLPLRTHRGGVLATPSAAEAATDLVRLAGRPPVAGLAAVVDDHGALRSGSDLATFCDAYALPLVSVGEVGRHRACREQLVERVADTTLPTDRGTFRTLGYRSAVDGTEHVVLLRGPFDVDRPPLVHIHLECLTGDLFSSRHCGCGTHLHEALERIVGEGAGIFIYLREHEGRGVGAALRAAEQDPQGTRHDHRVAAWILRELGIAAVRLMTDDADTGADLVACGIEVIEHHPLGPVTVAAPSRGSGRGAGPFRLLGSGDLPDSVFADVDQPFMWL